MRKMGKVKRERWIEICESLLRYYKHEKPKKGDNRDWSHICYMCKEAEMYVAEHMSACPKCLWTIIEKMDCFDLADKLYATSWPSICRKHRKSEWVKARIKMLKQWIRKLKREEV